MQIQDLLIRPGATPAESAPATVPVKELLPASGVSIGPPSAEDKVEISPLANLLLQASNQFAEAEAERVARLHTSYARGYWKVDPERLAARMIDASAAEGRPAGDEAASGVGRIGGESGRGESGRGERGRGESGRW
jgi:anti-sigma28 factor (negative regulator of flagellin synthesis)